MALTTPTSGHWRLECAITDAGHPQFRVIAANDRLIASTRTHIPLIEAWAGWNFVPRWISLTGTTPETSIRQHTTGWDVHLTWGDLTLHTETYANRRYAHHVADQLTTWVPTQDWTWHPTADQPTPTPRPTARRAETPHQRNRGLSWIDQRLEPSPSTRT